MIRDVFCRITFLVKSFPKHIQILKHDTVRFRVEFVGEEECALEANGGWPLKIFKAMWTKAGEGDLDGDVR